MALKTFAEFDKTIEITHHYFMEKDLLTFMGNHWLLVEDDVITVGLNDEGVEYADSSSKVTLPNENEEFEADEICGEIETDDGPINLYAPVDGIIVEVNTSVIETPEIIVDDPFGDGWLFKIEAKDKSAIAKLSVDLQKNDE